MRTRVLTLLLGSILFAAYLTGCGGGGGGPTPTTAPNTPPAPPPTQPVDTTKPAVTSTTPAHNSVAVSTNSAITVTFDESIAPATITATTFIVKADVTGAAVSGTVTYEESGKTAIFRPDSLAPNTAYTATVTTGVKDLASNAMAASYNWKFTTAEASDTDATPPTVLFTFPAANAGSVAMNTAVAATFSEAIDPATIKDNFILTKDGGVTKVAGIVTNVGTTVLFKPTDHLLRDTSYTAQISVGVKDLAGNALAENFTWGFTTGSALDQQSPQVGSVDPSPGEVDVLVSDPLVAIFKEPIMPFEFGLIEGRPVAVSFNATYTKATMTPTMVAGITYSSTLRVKDMAGNLLTYQWIFTTKSQ